MKINFGKMLVLGKKIKSNTSSSLPLGGNLEGAYADFETRLAEYLEK